MDWREIPGNRHAFDRLRDLVQGGQTISFVGAGASAGLYPLWNELIRRLADEAVNHGKASDAERAVWLGRSKDYPDQVVRGIKTELGDGVYADVLRQIFRPKAGADGRHFTRVQGALAQLPFRGHITTNFDPGLLEARHALRPEVRATGFSTWKDEDAVRRWENGDIFDEHPCPILFAHGIYERSDSVVLSAHEYLAAYRSGPFRRLFLHLWQSAHLVFVGFSFSDDWVKLVAKEVGLTGGTKRSTKPQHFALIGLPDSETYSKFSRDLITEQYDAEPVFYPVVSHADGSQDHGALYDILTALGVAPPPTAAAAPPPRTGGTGAPGAGPAGGASLGPLALPVNPQLVPANQYRVPSVQTGIDLDAYVSQFIAEVVSAVEAMSQLTYCAHQRTLTPEQLMDYQGMISLRRANIRSTQISMSLRNAILGDVAFRFLSSTVDQADEIDEAIAKDQRSRRQDYRNLGRVYVDVPGMTKSLGTAFNN